MTRHGHRKSRRGRGSITYTTWRGMVQRTTNPGHRSFVDYAGKVSPLFLGRGGFVRFLEAVGERPSRRHTLDRIDGSRGYEPGNLRWATKRVQEENKARATYYGRTVHEWAKALRVTPSAVRKRMERQWTDERAFPVDLRLAATK